MGTTLRDIVFDIGGGIVDGGAFKAVQTGGPSGGCIPAEHLDTPVDYESLDRARLDHGLGRHDRHGRDLLHGRRGQVLHGVLPRRVVRQVRPVPRRHRRRCTGCSTAITRGEATHGRPGPAGAARRDGQRHQPVRPGPGGAEPVCRARCATSATSTSPTSTTAPAPPGVCTDRPSTEARHEAVHTLHDRRRRRRRRGRARRSSRSPARTASTSRRCATSTGCPTSAPAGCARSRSPARSDCCPPA